MDFLNVVTVTRNSHKVFCLELACIFQSISNVLFSAGRDIYSLTESGVFTQVADIPLQPLLHQVEA